MYKIRTASWGSQMFYLRSLFQEILITWQRTSHSSSRLSTKMAWSLSNHHFIEILTRLYVQIRYIFQYSEAATILSLEAEEARRTPTSALPTNCLKATSPSPGQLGICWVENITLTLARLRFTTFWPRTRPLNYNCIDLHSYILLVLKDAVHCCNSLWGDSCNKRFN